MKLRHVIAILVVGTFLVAPMFIIKELTTDTVDLSSSATATVALGTVLRSNGRNLIRSTFMSAVRTALRAITRRVIRSILPTLLRLFLPAFRTSTQRSLEEIEAANPQPLPLAMGLGLVVLASSFYWVVELNSEVSIDQLSPGFSLFVFSLLAATTVIFHYSIMFWVGLKTNVTVSMRTSIDGILLQAYFTGAQSYLPLASDMELTGSLEDKAKCSNITLLALLGLSLLMDSIGTLFFAPVLKIWGAHLLLYVFVISFPLKPLEGSDIFAVSKGMWLLTFLLVLLTFLFNMPEAFYAIL